MNNKVIHGFRFVSERALPELEATLREAVYEKNGAKLLFIDRKESNKTFSIAFKTIPTDDTGVFHIIEHSVLCGSDKFPVKEPFVELLKGSLKTFLNAMTFPDKTMYPISSRNDKDFLNLVDVYMDAVFNPIAMRKPEIFMQEGWHYELHSPEEEMLYKGVVFNEMKGAYSSADELMMSSIAKLLYKGTCYSHDSGGDPLAIPNLTYEQFVASHKKFYHPSGAFIFLDGAVDLDKTLALLDSYLSKYEYQELDTEIVALTPAGHTEKTISYEISENEDPEGKARVCLGFYAGDYTERRRAVALAIIIAAIAGSNDSPFKKKMLDLGICEDVNFSTYDGIRDNSILIEIKNVKVENMKLAESEALRILREILDTGIDKELLSAFFNNLEFRIREQDNPSQPSGITYAISALDTWLYGGDPMDALAFEDDLAYLREKLGTDYYEAVLRETILESSHSATLYMIPSATLGEERVAEEKRVLKAKKESMSPDELNDTIAANTRLEEWQRSDDSEQALATIPALTKDDISPLPEEYPIEKYNLDETEALFTPIASRGILYTKLLFDVGDLTAEELSLASLLAELLKNLPTSEFDTVSLQTKIKSELGSFVPSILTATKNGIATPYFLVGISALVSKLGAVPKITEQVLLNTLFEDTSAIGKIVRQIKIGAQEGISASGHAAAMGRCAAYVSSEAAMSEYIDGIENYLYIKKLDSEFDTASGALVEKLENLAKKIFTRKRLTVYHAGERNDAFIESLLQVFPEGSEMGERVKIEPLGVRREGILIPAQISFASQSGNVYELEETPHGSLTVIRSILSYGFLWNAIRVQGGAYGAGFTRRANGIAAFYTYRDPDANRSIDCFRQSADFLRQTAESGEDITNLIIGAIGDTDPLITPKLLSALALVTYLRGETFEDRARFRSEMINTSAPDLLRAADLIDKITAGGVCVIGGKDKLDACGDKLTSFIEI